MDWMKDKPDNYYDLCICDLPYGINVSKTGAVGGIRKKTHNKWKNERVNNYGKKQWDEKIIDKERFVNIIRISNKQIIFGANYYAEYLNKKYSVVVWNKETSGKFSDGELIFVPYGKGLKIYNYLWNGFAVKCGKVNRIHINQKPIDLYKWLLKNYAKPGDKIFDPCVGSGSIRIACHDMGFDFEGTEIDKDYWQAQEDRFQAHIAQNELFKKDELQDLIYRD
jgi:site-specific DNA-methyltransferase (adenine-specific)